MYFIVEDGMNEIKWSRRTRDVEEQQELKLRAVLDVAAHSITTRGYQKTTLDSLARELELTKPALYYYVRNKEDILLKCANLTLKITEGCLTDAIKASDIGLEQLRFFVRAFAEVVVSDYGTDLIREARRYLQGQAYEQLISNIKSGSDMLEKIVLCGIDDGSIRPCSPRHVAFMLFSTLGAMGDWYDPDGPDVPSEIADRFLDVVIHGIGEASK